MKIYGLYDKKGAAYSQFFTFKGDYEVYRNLAVAVKQADSFLSQYCEDFDLYCLGDIDPVKGTITGSPDYLVNLAELKEYK